MDVVTRITSDLELALELGLVRDEKERDSATLVTVTQSHVNKTTPALCDAIKVVAARSNDTRQRTKFEAVKYQWATKFKLLTIAINDTLGNHLVFPTYDNRKDAWTIIDDLEKLLESVDIIAEQLKVSQFNDLVARNTTKLTQLTEKLDSVHLMDPAQYIELRLETSFAVYCLQCAIQVTCGNVSAMIPTISRLMADESSITFDPVSLSDSADDAIDMIKLITDKLVAENPEKVSKTDQLSALSSSLMDSLVLISDHPNTEVTV